MVEKEWKTDEDELIYHLEAHKNLIGWVMDKLQEAGIPCERTRGRNPNGDILYYRSEDEAQVKEIVREINAKYNQL